tara:strand:+ start:4305 stop:4655 length:351 start_codon:yes stop_codon:yes gene_type:complete
MDEDTFLKLLDETDRDLDAFPFWSSFKRACKANPIKGIEALTPGRQAVLILWEAHSQIKDENGNLNSTLLEGEGMSEKLQGLKDDLIGHFMNEQLDERALNKFFSSIVSSLKKGSL